jgi:hypothetical protein
MIPEPRSQATLSEYFTALVYSGLVVRQMVGPYPYERRAMECPDLADARTVPRF